MHDGHSSRPGTSRRAFLSAGAASLFGFNLAPSLLAGHIGSANPTPVIRNDLSVIIV